MLYADLLLAALLAGSGASRLGDDINLVVVQPGPATCTFPDFEVKVDITLQSTPTDVFMSDDLYLHGKVCAMVDQGRPQEQGPYCSAMSGNGSISFHDMTPGCHTVAAHVMDRYNATVKSSATVEFQVSSDSFTCASDKCALQSADPIYFGNVRLQREDGTTHNSSDLFTKREDTELHIEWPRPDDLVWSNHVIINVQFHLPNGLMHSNFSEVCFRWELQAVGHEGIESSPFKEKCLHDFGRSFVEFTIPMDMVSVEEPQWLKVNVRATAMETPEREIRNATMFYLQRYDRQWSIVAEHVPLPIAHIAEWRRGRGMIVPAEDIAANLWVLPHVPLLLVVNRYEEDISWLPHQPYPAFVYERKPPHNVGKHAVSFNLGNEAAGYLKFIVDYYDDLPKRVLFLHGHRYAYHQEDLLILLHRLQHNESQYCNINSMLWGDKDRVILGDQNFIQEQWHWMGQWLGRRPQYLISRCCAQMMVHRDRIRRHPKEFYLMGLAHISLAVDSEENRKWGLLYEWLWHYIFGEPALDPDLAHVLPYIRDIDRAQLNDRARCIL